MLFVLKNTGTFEWQNFLWIFAWHFTRNSPKISWSDMFLKDPRTPVLCWVVLPPTKTRFHLSNHPFYSWYNLTKRTKTHTGLNGLSPQRKSMLTRAASTRHLQRVKSVWGRFVRDFRRIVAVTLVWKYEGLNWYLQNKSDIFVPSTFFLFHSLSAVFTTLLHTHGKRAKTTYSLRTARFASTSYWFSLACMSMYLSSVWRFSGLYLKGHTIFHISELVTSAQLHWRAQTSPAAKADHSVPSLGFKE